MCPKLWVLRRYKLEVEAEGVKKSRNKKVRMNASHSLNHTASVDANQLKLCIDKIHFYVILIKERKKGLLKKGLLETDH